MPGGGLAGVRRLLEVIGICDRPLCGAPCVGGGFVRDALAIE